MTASDIINIAFYITESDVDVWESDDDEYTLANHLANLSIQRFETYENSRWRVLLGTLTGAADGDKTISAVHQYTCPSDFMYPSSWVRTTINSTVQFWQVIPVEKIAKYAAETTMYYCYFLGNEKDGFTINFNPNITMPTGATLEYEYYKKAARFTNPYDETEVPDPYYIAYYIAAHLGEDGINQEFFQIAEQRLEQMRVVNMSHVFDVPDTIDYSGDEESGFGY